jgi:tryptophanase
LSDSGRWETRLIPAGRNPFKGNIDIAKLRKAIEAHGPENVAFVRMEATTNLIGGQPFSMQNLREVNEIAKKHGLLLVLDGSLIGENASFIKQREAGYADGPFKKPIEMMSLVDIFYMSGRKSGGARGGLIATNNKQHFDHLMTWLPVYEGFSTYGGMSTKEIEAMAVGLEEMTQTEVAGRPESFSTLPSVCRSTASRSLLRGLACHVDARRSRPMSHLSSIRRRPPMQLCT